MTLRTISPSEPELLIYGADPVRWANRWGLVPFSTPCLACGRLKHTSIPFVRHQMRGLMAPPCECGDPARTYCIVRDYRFGDLFGGNWRI
jgi:hypothetical protein